MRPCRRTVGRRMADDRPIQAPFQQHVEDLRLVIRPDRKRHITIRPYRHRRPVIPARFHAGRFPASSNASSTSSCVIRSASTPLGCPLYDFIKVNLSIGYEVRLTDRAEEEELQVTANPSRRGCVITGNIPKD